MRIGSEPITSRRKLSDLLRSMTMAASVTPTRSDEAVAEHGEVGEHLADFDAALVRRADDPLGPLPGDLGGKRQGVGPEQLGRLG